MSKASKTILAIVGVIVLAIAAGFLGSSLRGGGGGGAGAASTEGAWIAKIKKNGELRVGIAAAPPMTGEQPDGTLGGPNVIPLQKLAKEMGVKFTAVPADWSNIVAGLQADRYDVAAYLDATSERSLAIQFTDPVYTYQMALVVRDGDGLTTFDDVIARGEGKVGFTSGSSYQQALEDALGFELVGIDKTANGISSVKSKRIDAFALDLPTAAAAAQEDPTLKVLLPDPVVYQVDSNWGVSENIDARSLQVLNIAIRNAFNDGSLQRAFDEAGIPTPETLGDLRATR